MTAIAPAAAIAATTEAREIGFNGFGTGRPALPAAAMQRILRCSDEMTQGRLERVNRAWHQAIVDEAYLGPDSDSDASLIPGFLDSYRIKTFDPRVRTHFIASAVKGTHDVAVKVLQGDNAKRAWWIQRRLKGTTHLLLPEDHARLLMCDRLALLQLYPINRIISLGKVLPKITALTDNTLQERLLFLIVEGIINGLREMHSKGICHLNLHLGSVVITSEGRVKITSFEAATEMKEGFVNLAGRELTHHFWAPERESSTLCDGGKLDAWALGCILLIFKGHRLPELTSNSIFHKKLDDILELISPAPDSFWGLIKSLLQVDPEKRLPINRIHTDGWMIRMATSSSWREAIQKQLVDLITVKPPPPPALPTPFPSSTLASFILSKSSPIELAQYVERPALKGILKQWIRGASDDKTSTLVCTGAEGSGKTGLIGHLIREAEIWARFTQILWFRSSTLTSYLETQIHLLARSLALVDATAPFDMAQKTLQDHLASSIKRTGKPSLIVFDDADGAEQLRKYIPAQGTQVIVISHQPRSAETLHIGPMIPSEAIALVEKLLQSRDPAYASLCEILGYIPEAIRSACHYLRTQKVTVESYLKQIAHYEDLKAWRHGLAQLTHSEMVLLHQLCFLSVDGIPDQIIKALNRPTLLKKLYDLGLIDSYSNRIPKALKRLVFSQQEASTESACIQTMDLLNKLYRYQPTDAMGNATNLLLFPHGEQLLHYANRIPSLSPRFLSPFTKTLQWVGNCYTRTLGNAKNKHFNLKKVLPLMCRSVGGSEGGVAAELNRLGTFWNAHGDPEQALRFHSAALEIFGSIPGNLSNVAATLSHLGGSYGKLGRHRRAIAYYRATLHRLPPSSELLVTTCKKLEEALVLAGIEPLDKAMSMSEFIKTLTRPLAKSFFQLGQLEASIHKKHGASRREMGLLNLVRYILTFANRKDHIELRKVNKRWKDLATPFCQYPYLPSEDNIPGKRGRYQLKRTLHYSDIEMIAKQTGLELPLPRGAHFLTDVSLGRGISGEIYIGYNPTRAHFIGIKIIRGEHQVNAERRVMDELRTNPRIFCPYDITSAISPRGEVTCYQAMDLAGLGSALQLISILPTLDASFREMLLFHIAEGLFQALQEMHKRDFCHLDLKPANFAATKEGQIVLIDFGCAAKMTRGKVSMKKCDGEECDGDENTYSPERWLSRIIPERRICDGDKVDMWAAGLSLLALCGVDAVALFGKRALRPLVVSADPEATLRRYVAEQFTLLPVSRAPDSIGDLILHLLHPDPTRRFTAAQALEHRWIVKMAKETAPHRDKIVGYLREFVQTKQRYNIQATAKTAPTFDALSPQGLPSPHFTSFVPRPTIQATLERRVFDTPLTIYLTSTPTTALQGAGGLGKTTLLAYLLHDHRTENRFGLRLWFYDSDRPERVQAQCVTLARELGLIEEKTPPDEAIRRLHQYLSTYPQRFRKPWIAIFDNADTPEHLRNFLPKAGGHILISSRLPWPDSIAVDILTEDEGRALVAKLLFRDDPQSIELCRALGCHPLGIMQACAYLRNHQLTIPVFLEELSKSTAAVSRDERLLRKHLPSSIAGLYRMTFEKLRTRSPEAMAQLELYAYLASDRLPQLTFSSTATALLKEYSLLQGRDLLSMHKLLQMTIREGHDMGEQATILKRALRLLWEAFDDEPSLEAIKCNRDITTHGEILLQHCEKLLSSIELEATATPESEGAAGAAAAASTITPAAAAVIANFAVRSLLEPVLQCLNFGWAQLILRIEGVRRGYSTPSNRLPKLEKALALLVLELGDENPRVGEAHKILGRALSSVGDYGRAITHFNKALTIFRSGKSLMAIAKCLHDLAITRSLLGEYRQANEDLRQVLDLYKTTLGKRHPLVGSCLDSLGYSYYVLGEYRKAMEHHQQALEILEEFLGKSHPDLESPLINLANAWQSLGDSERAIALFDRAALISRNIHGEDDRQAFVLDKLTATRLFKGDHRTGVDFLEKSIAYIRNTMGDTHPYLAPILSRLGATLADFHNTPRRALECCEQALKIAKTLGDNHPLVATTLHNFGIVKNKLDDFQGAIKCHNQAIEIQKKIFGEKNPEVTLSYTHLGINLYEIGEVQTAINRYLLAIGIIEETLGKDHIQLAIPLNQLSTALLSLENYDDAIKHQQRALDIRKRVLPAGHLQIAESQMILGRILNGSGDHRKAIGFFEQAYPVFVSFFGRENFNVGEVLCHLGRTYISLGEFDKGNEYSNQALAIYKKILGERHPKFIKFIEGLGMTWCIFDKPELAIRYFKEHLTLQKQVLGEENLEIAGSLKRLGLLYAKIDDYRKAIEYLTPSIAIIKKLGGEGPDLADALFALGMAYKGSGDLAQAKATLLAAYEMSLRVLGTEHPNTLFCRHALDNLALPMLPPSKRLPREEETAFPRGQADYRTAAAAAVALPGAGRAAAGAGIARPKTATPAAAPAPKITAAAAAAGAGMAAPATATAAAVPPTSPAAIATPVTMGPALPMRPFDAINLSRLSDDQVLKALAGADPDELNLSHCPEVTDGLFRGMRSLRRLSILNLDGCRTITGKGFHFIAYLPIQKLILKRTAITYKTLSVLNPATLIHLDLEGTPTDDLGLGQVAWLTALKVLNLRKTRITNSGLRRLTPLTQLEILNLSLNEQITDDCIEHLSHLRHVKELYLGDTGISATGFAMLRSRMGACKIVSGRQESR